MGATFANHPHPPRPICLILNEFVHPHPQPHTQARTHERTRARIHTQRVWKNTLQNLQCFLLIANENDKGLFDTTRYNSYNYYITLANLCGEDPLQISFILGQWDYRGMCNFSGCCLKT